ncbi:alcohol dehydrogenase catalytic domain-containing protein [Levilactobacillus tongjiangensis]|uniref:Alcohol dehydrogenase catalytic domain-containing protein n=1 Tax=Levilactobacillus tongjiangensis TaxID=2486023 RepID=A0ABW1SRZ9_9LACO|nr:zinc-binding dehydrogenase [Levilactobacillus tongjiangensis]
MHAVVVNRPGGPEVLEYTEVPTPAVRPGWTRVKVRGFGINHSEIFTREGKSPSVQFPRILGIEVVGTVDETSAPDQFHLGQTVVSLMGEMGRAFDGSYAEYVLLPNDQVYPIKTKLDWAQLAAVPETFYTAFGIYQSLRLQAGDRVLIRAATSGVGVAVLKLMNASGLNLSVTGTSRSTRKDSALKQLGIDQVLHTPDANVLPAGAGEFDKIVDLMGPSAVRDSLQHTAEWGIVSATGELGGVWTLDGFDPIMDIPNNRYLTGFYSGHVDAARIQSLFDFIAEHQVDVTPEHVFTLAETRAAHAYLATSDGLGKVVVLP